MKGKLTEASRSHIVDIQSTYSWHTVDLQPTVLCISCWLDLEMWALYSKVKADERKLAGVGLNRLNDWRSPAYFTGEKSVVSPKGCNIQYTEGNPDWELMCSSFINCKPDIKQTRLRFELKQTWTINWTHKQWVTMYRARYGNMSAIYTWTND